MVPHSAHAAFDKACFYLGVEIRKAKLNPCTLRVDLESMESLIDRNTITVRVLVISSWLDLPLTILSVCLKI